MTGTSQIARAPAPIRTLQQLVAKRHGLTLEQLLSRTRTARIASARALAIALCRECTGFSSTEIGRAFGRDHTTMLNAWRAIVDRCATDRSFDAAYVRLQRDAVMALEKAHPHA